MINYTLQTKMLLCLMAARLLLGASLASAAEATPDADPLAGVVPKQATYQPGETIAIHRNLPPDCWPQLGNTPQRTNYSPMVFDPPQGQLQWSVCLSDLDLDNRINATVQPIIAEGRVYVGCKNGKLFALNAKTGAVMWTFQASGPICHTAGYAAGRVMVATLDGCVFALNAATGQQEWVFHSRSADRRQHGFSCAVLLAEDRVFAVDRGGRLFALDIANGKELWHYDAGAPVDQSPAYDAGKIFFASEDMRVHAIRSADGVGVWNSDKLTGLSFRWFYPVVVGGKVLVRSLSSGGYGVVDNTETAQRSLIALDEDSGKESIVLKQKSMGHDGTQPPPAVTGDGLLLVQWWPAVIPKSSISQQVWALEDLKSQEILMPLLESEKRPANVRSNVPFFAGLWCGNENHVESVIGEIVMTMHPTGIYDASGTMLGGAFDLRTRRWFLDVHGCLPGADSLGWEHTGGDGNESGGSSAMSAADGLLYQHLKRKHTIICYKPLRVPATVREVTP